MNEKQTYDENPTKTQRKKKLRNVFLLLITSIITILIIFIPKKTDEDNIENDELNNEFNDELPLNDQNSEIIDEIEKKRNDLKIKASNNKKGIKKDGINKPTRSKKQDNDNTGKPTKEEGATEGIDKLDEIDDKPTE